MDCSPPGSSVQGILQARILEWIAVSFSRGSSQPRDWTPVSCIAGRFLTVWGSREALIDRIKERDLRAYFVLSSPFNIKKIRVQRRPVTCQSGPASKWPCRWRAGAQLAWLWGQRLPTVPLTDEEWSNPAVAKSGDSHDVNPYRSL